MYKSRIFILSALALLSASVFAAKNGSLKFENRVRVGMDDNIYLEEDNTTDTTFVTDIVSIMAKISFSMRSDFLVYYEPEFRYRADADPDFVTYHNLYAELNHKVSQVVSVTISDRLKYQDKDGQSDVLGQPGVSQSFLENELQGAVDLMISSKSSVKVSAAHQFRTWDDSNYGDENDFTQIRGDVKFQQELRPATTYGFVGAGYTDLAYDNDARGGYESIVAYVGMGHAFTPRVNGNIQAGYTMAEVDTGAVQNDNNTPFVSAGLDYSLSDRTTVSVSGGYSLYRSENQNFNAQERLDASLGMKHDLTGKISVSAYLSYILSNYSADNAYIIVVTEDVEDTLIKARLRASYQINRNNFIEAGYEFSTRDGGDFFNDYDRSIVDIGWRLTL